MFKQYSCGIMEVAKRKEIDMAKLPKYKVKYYLDETDQIEVDGHTLSRLYLAETPPELFTKMHDYAIYGEDNTNRKMGGYVESLDCLTDTVTYHGHICWVDEDSRVYGDSKIGRDVTIHRSTIANSKVTQARGAWVADSTIINSTVNLVKASAIINSTCTKEVLSSTFVIHISKCLLPEQLSTHLVWQGQLAR